MFKNIDDWFTWKNEDRQEIIDFELIWNKKIKVFYFWYKGGKLEKIINL